MSYQILTQEEIHGRNTRYRRLIPKNMTRTQIQQNCLRNFLPSIMNETSSDILDKINTHSFKGYSNYAKMTYINKYSTVCQIEHCYICEN